MQTAVVQCPLDLFAGDDAVARGVGLGHLHDRDDRAVRLVIRMDELADARPIANHHIVREDHRERLVADDLLGHEDGMPEAELLLLADVRDLSQVRDVPDLAEHVDVALFLEQPLELIRGVEVILDRALLARRDDDHERQHLLRLGLRRRQEAGPPSGGGEDGLANAHETSVDGWGWRSGEDTIGLGVDRSSGRRREPQRCV